MMKKNGYVLLETIISLGLLSLILFCVSAMTFNFAKVNQKIINGRDRFENLRLGQYFLSEQIQRADKIEIVTDSNSSMKSITTYIFNSDTGKYKTNHSFLFKNNNIEFGGHSDKNIPFTNDLAQNISDVKINYDSEKKLLRVEIAADDSSSVISLMYLGHCVVDFCSFSFKNQIKLSLILISHRYHL